MPKFLKKQIVSRFLFHAMFLIIFRAASFLTRMSIAMYWECPYCGTSFFHGEGRWTKYLPINARMFIFTERWKEILIQRVQNDPLIAEKHNCTKKSANLFKHAKYTIMQRASLGFITSKCFNPPSTFCLNASQGRQKCTHKESYYIGSQGQR